MVINNYVRKWTLSLTQSHKNGLVRWGLHLLIYYNLTLSLVDMGLQQKLRIGHLKDKNIYFMGGVIGSQLVSLG